MSIIQSSRSISPSFVSLPEGDGFATVYEFMLFRFPRIAEPVWRERIELGKVYFDDGGLIDSDTLIRRTVAFVITAGSENSRQNQTG